MKGQRIIELIQSRNLEGFDFKFSFTDGHGESGFPNVRTFSIDELCDIGYSSNEVSLTGEEK